MAITPFKVTTFGPIEIPCNIHWFPGHCVLLVKFLMPTGGGCLF